MALRSWGGWIRYGLPGLALGIGLAWGLEGKGPSSALAQVSAPIPLPSPAADRARGLPPAQMATSGDGSGTIVLSTPVGGNAHLLTLVDPKAHAFVVYRIDPTNPKGTVKLEAARQYQWDLKLTEYNNQPPEVAAIESTVKSLGQPNR